MQSGPLRLVLQACNRTPGEADGWISDAAVARLTDVRLPEVRDCIESLDDRGYVRSARTTDGLKVQITAEGRLFLSQRRRFPDEAERGKVEPAKVEVVPKGLRSYDEHDADFFLDLLPGPGRLDGLPESIHFWKTRIEETDHDKTFRIGLIYGPSGCGKSSLVKAGLIPRLASHILTIYVEAAADETEARLLRELLKRCPNLSADLDLNGVLSALSDGRLISPGHKVLIVIDQFEQWLHANSRSSSE